MGRPFCRKWLQPIAHELASPRVGIEAQAFKAVGHGA
jgi:hypothetical protein